MTSFLFYRFGGMLMHLCLDKTIRVFNNSLSRASGDSPPHVSRNRVVSPVIPGVATAHPLQSEPAPSGDPVPGNCFQGILAAARMEAAESFTDDDAKETPLARDEALVKADEHEDRGFQHTG